MPFAAKGPPRGGSADGPIDTVCLSANASIKATNPAPAQEKFRNPRARRRDRLQEIHAEQPRSALDIAWEHLRFTQEHPLLFAEYECDEAFVGFARALPVSPELAAFEKEIDRPDVSNDEHRPAIGAWLDNRRGPGRSTA